MNRLEIIETLLHWLMWISLGALLLIAAACAYVGLRRVSQVLYARLRPAAIGVFAVAAIIATGEAQKRLYDFMAVHRGALLVYHISRPVNEIICQIHLVP